MITAPWLVFFEVVTPMNQVILVILKGATKSVFFVS